MKLHVQTIQNSPHIIILIIIIIINIIIWLVVYLPL